MRVELLEFKRCCCCIPLRYGILFSGYVKLFLAILVFIPVVIHLVVYLRTLLFDEHIKEIWSIKLAVVILSIFLLVISVDMAFTIVLLVGGHKKNPHLLKVFQYYSIGMLVLYILGFILSTAAEMVSYSTYGLLSMALATRPSIVLGLLNIVGEIYLILVNRSEILKLENNCQFQFVNNADRVECVMSQPDTYVQNSDPGYEVEHEILDQEMPEVESEERKRKLNGNYARL